MPLYRGVFTKSIFLLEVFLFYIGLVWTAQIPDLKSIENMCYFWTQVKSWPKRSSSNQGKTRKPNFWCMRSNSEGIYKNFFLSPSFEEQWLWKWNVWLPRKILKYIEFDCSYSLSSILESWINVISLLLRNLFISKVQYQSNREQPVCSDHHFQNQRLV